MKVGDLVRWYGIEDHGGLNERVTVDNGLVIQLSRSGQDSLHALVLFENGNLDWIPDAGLEVIDESR
jgi:hypothetical protein